MNSQNGTVPTQRAPVRIDREIDTIRLNLLNKFFRFTDNGSQLFFNVRNVFHFGDSHTSILFRSLCNVYKELSVIKENDCEDKDVFLSSFVKLGIGSIPKLWRCVVNMYQPNFTNYEDVYNRLRNNLQFNNEIRVLNYFTLIICSLMVEYNYHKDMHTIISVFEQVNSRYGLSTIVASNRVKKLVNICSQSEFIVWNEFRNSCDLIEHVIFGFVDGDGKKHYVSIDFIHGKLSECSSWSERIQEPVPETVPVPNEII